MLRERIYQLGGWQFWSLAVAWFALGWLAVPLVWNYHLWVMWWIWLRWVRHQVSSIWQLAAAAFFGLHFAVLAGWMLGIGMIVSLTWWVLYQSAYRIPVALWKRDWIGIAVIAAGYWLVVGSGWSEETLFWNSTGVIALLFIERVARGSASR